MVIFPEGFRLESLQKKHRRKQFRSGVTSVDAWLAAKSLQHQEKHLSATKVLLDRDDTIAGYYTLAMGQVDFGELPAHITRQLPRRALPVAFLAWLGVDQKFQGQGLGGRLLAQSLHDFFEAGKTFAFIAVLIDCVNDSAKSFYQQWDFEELPGQPYRLFLSIQRLKAIME